VTDSESGDDAEVQPLQNERSRVLLDQITEVERAVAALHADVVRQVHRAVDIEVDVVAGVLVVDRGQLEERQFARDRHRRYDVDAADAADGRDRRSLLNELANDRTVERYADVCVLQLRDEAGEARVAAKEVVLVPEAVRLPV